MAVPVKKVDFLMTQRMTVIGLESNVFQERLNGNKDKEVKVCILILCLLVLLFHTICLNLR